MGTGSNISSEEELLQLREEGKISEAEYHDLLTAMVKSPPEVEEPALSSETGDAKTKQKRGKTALFVMLAGLLLPAIGYAIVVLSTGPNQGAWISPWFFLGVAFEIVAFALGVSSWPDIHARVTVIAIGVLAAFILLLISLSYLSRLKSERALLDMKMTEAQRAREAQTTSLPPIRNEVELKSYPLDDMEGLLTRSGVSIDKSISSDGNGSLKINTTEPTKIRLFETGDIDIEEAKLFYQAKLQTEKIQGEVYLEMWCHFPGRGEFFSKGLTQDKPLSGTTNWTTEEIPFLLREGENPDNVKLNLVINGKGTVWIDDIRLLKGPLI